jgi:hypothetical protein
VAAERRSGPVRNGDRVLPTKLSRFLRGAGRFHLASRADSVLNVAPRGESAGPQGLGRVRGPKA